MALSLSPRQLQHHDVIHTPLLPSSEPLQSHSWSIATTPRQFAVAHDGPGHKILSMSKIESHLLGARFDMTREDVNGKLVSSSHILPDLPSWTPLKTLGEDERSSVSDSEVDEPSTRNADLATKRLRGSPANAQETVVNIVTKPALKPVGSSDAQPYKAKKARFDGVLITTKPPPYKKYGSRTKAGPTSASSTRVMSLVDALARTFDANRHTEDSFTHRSRTGLDRRDNALTAQQTDAETSTEAEDDQLRLNTRLARTPLKRRLPRTNTVTVSANVSEASSEEVTFLQRDIPQPERLPGVKRLKPIQYESNAALIDAALGTLEAPISWDAASELDFITKDDEYAIAPLQIAPPASADNQMAVDGDSPPGSPVEAFIPPSTQVGDECRMPMWGSHKRAVLSPYVSRGAKFRQRLHAIFGENATVRTDRVAKPRPIDHDFFAPLDEPDRVRNPPPSESTISVSSASTAEGGTSAIPSTHITSQSPDIPSADISMDQLPGTSMDSTTKSALNASEEQMNSWIAALQRLTKGKVHVREEDLETVSIVLAEIESTKDNLGNVFMTSELHERIKQLSELHEIPFGDRNRLRQRAENISQTWPSMMETDAS